MAERKLGSRAKLLAKQTKIEDPTTFARITVQEFVQERAHFCSRSDKQKKFANWGDLPR